MPLTNISVINKLNVNLIQRFTRTYIDFVTSVFMQLPFRDIKFFFDLTSSLCKIVQDSLNWILYFTLSPGVRFRNFSGPKPVKQ